MLLHHPHRTLTQFGRISCRSLVCHGSILSRFGASGKPGAVQNELRGGFGQTNFAAGLAKRAYRGRSADIWRGSALPAPETSPLQERAASAQSSARLAL